MMKTLIRIISLGIVLAAFLVSACKGKEEKQTFIGSPAPKQGTDAGSSESPPGVPGSAVSPGDAYAPLSVPPRVISVKLSPEKPVRGDKIKAEVAASGKEGESVTIEYHWSKNDTPLSETSDTLFAGGDFKPGDRITLTAVPDDGKRKGSPMSVVVFVGNSPPTIVPSEETFRFVGREYSYKVKATDPDGDTLTYSLKVAPSGMSIDSSTGSIHWTIPADFRGKVPVTVVVSDGHGGEAMMNYTLEIPR